MVASNFLMGPLKAPDFKITLWQKIPFQKPLDIWSTMVNKGTYFDKPSSVRAPLYSLKGPPETPFFQ